jgi:hypothetical protein
VTSARVARCLVAVAFAGTAACAGTAAPGGRPAPSGTVSESSVRRILSALAHDSMEGRFTGSPGANRAASFIAAEMKAIGLTAAGDSGYLQKIPFTTHPRRGVAPLESFAALDTIPVANRRIGYNVIGVMPGGDAVLKDEIVVIGAHYDHEGIGPAVDGDSIFNGADDDASGVTAVLSIARALAAGPRPKRTIVFMTTTGEEQGILGTRWYVQHPVFPISRMVADMEIEMIGRPDSLAGGAGKAWLTGYERSTMGEMLRSADVPIVADPYPAQRFFERSDNIVFARMGIPAHTLSSYNMHKDYHTVNDEVDKVDFAHMTAVINAAVRATRLLADGTAPQWKEGGRPPQR